jgi:nucleoside-diphosphate-sugar epimerase
MRHVLVSGGTGMVGRFVVERLIADGAAVSVLGRTPPPAGFFSRPVRFRPGRLDPAAADPDDFSGVEAFVHAAFDHLPGRFRGGEGSDPAGFRARNVEGSSRLFEAACRAGVARIVFVSSRAVYGERSGGGVVTEADTPQPDSLYGEVKLAAERALAGLADGIAVATSLRITGVYGPGGPRRPHKWAALFDDYLAGRPIAPRAGTEVHGADVAAAVALVLRLPAEQASAAIFNVSDLVVDRRDLLALVRAAAASPAPLPQAARASLTVMATDRLRALGWRPGGRPALAAFVAEAIGSPRPGGPG